MGQVLRPAAAHTGSVLIATFARAPAV